jgi:spermidine/putrescine-binding protein
MKKIAIASVAVAAAVLAGCVTTKEAQAAEETIVVTPAVEFSKYVGVERATEADTTIAYAGVGVTKGALDVGLQLDLDLKDGDEQGEIDNVNLAASLAVTEALSLYTSNDFDRDFERTETKVGVKYNF